MPFPTGLDEYLERWAGELGKQAAAACKPLHVPGVDDTIEPELLRQSFPAQAHVISAGVKALRESDAIQIAAQMGTGKTYISQAICHAHADGPYRAIVFAPPHLVGKWVREIQMTIPRAHTHVIENYRQVARVLRHAPVMGYGWFILSNTKAKLGPKWKPSYRLRPKVHSYVLCPTCFKEQTELDKETGLFVKVLETAFHKKRRKCTVCGEPMWAWTHEIDRWPVATFVHKKLRNWFDYCIIDESHQAKSAEAAVGQVMGSLVAGCRKTIALTGTLLGGYAWHVRPLLFRIAPGPLMAEGLGWDKEMAFNERYGRLERKVTETQKRGGRDNKQSKGTTTKTIKYVRPGVMPQLFGRHLLSRTIFLSLAEVADNLPPLHEIILPVKMDDQQFAAYKETEKALSDAIKQMLSRKDKRLLSKMLQTLLGYCDHPWGWGEIGYWDRDEEGDEYWHHVVTPKNLDPKVIRPKERELIDLVKREVAEGRQCWVYSVMTDARDVVGRLTDLFKREGLRAENLRSSVGTGDREDWIAERGPNLDVCVSHPQLVETGLDLFAHDGRHNFASLIFYQTGYSTFTLRQAAARAWRIGQKKECRTYYLYYEETMQARAMTLMGKKLSASQAIEGKFSSEGLAAMAGDEGTLELALAKSLVEKLDDLDVGRTWDRLGATPKITPVGEAGPSKPLADAVAAPEQEPIILSIMPEKAPERANAEVVLPSLPDLLPGLWFRPKSGHGLAMQIVEVYGQGRFVDFKEFGKRAKQTLQSRDVLRLYEPW